MSVHKPVLLKETIENLKIEAGDIVIDATLGGGGHSLEILKRILPDGKLIAIDRDKNAIDDFKKRLADLEPRPKKENITLIFDNFADLKNILASLKINSVAAIVADLGLSSDQLEKAERGFSFKEDSDLDMRMDQRQSLSAKEIVNTYRKEDLAKIFRDYGDEKYAARIAEAIAEERKKKIIKTTGELVSVIERAVPGVYKRQKIPRKSQGGTRGKHFATRVFQALRIEVNDELGNLEKFIPEAVEALKENGRLAIITFHSGEDKIVKNIFRQNAKGCVCPKEFPVCVCHNKPKVRIINKKPILPSDGELEANPRARSAKLRIIEKI